MNLNLSMLSFLGYGKKRKKYKRGFDNKRQPEV